MKSQLRIVKRCLHLHSCTNVNCIYGLRNNVEYMEIISCSGKHDDRMISLCLLIALTTLWCLKESIRLCNAPLKFLFLGSRSYVHAVGRLISSTTARPILVRLGRTAGYAKMSLCVTSNMKKSPKSSRVSQISPINSSYITSVFVYCF